MIERLEPKQIRILKALARYKFLTYKQIIRLGIFNHKSNLSNAMIGLRDRRRPFARTIPHGVGSGDARHYLTKFGKKVLLQLYGEEYSESTIQFVDKVIYTDSQDQDHRTSIVRIQIELDFACYENDLQLILCERYFDTVGNRRKDNNLISKTAIEFEKGASINADLTFMIQTPFQRELYLLELENGNDVKKGLKKCIKHGKAILSGTANEKYNHPHGYRTLWVFKTKSTMHGTMKLIQSSPFFDNLREFYLFKSLEEIKSEFLGGWMNASGQERKLYYI